LNDLGADNIITDLRETGCRGDNCKQLAHHKASTYREKPPPPQKTQVYIYNSSGIGTRILRICENRILWRKCAPEREEVTGEDYIMRSFITCTLHLILLG